MKCLICLFPKLQLNLINTKTRVTHHIFLLTIRCTKLNIWGSVKLELCILLEGRNDAYISYKGTRSKHLECTAQCPYILAFDHIWNNIPKVFRAAYWKVLQIQIWERATMDKKSINCIFAILLRNKLERSWKWLLLGALCKLLDTAKKFSQLKSTIVWLFLKSFDEHSQE